MTLRLRVPLQPYARVRCDMSIASIAIWQFHASRTELRLASQVVLFQAYGLSENKSGSNACR
jgi:hypothetical protein